MTAIMPDEGMPVAAVAPQPEPSRQIAAAPQSAVSQAPDAGTEPDSRVEQIRVNGHPRIFIQAGAFRQYVNANRLRARLTPLGHPVNVSQIYVTNQPFFRVRLGPLANVEDADLALERIVSLGYPEARIVVD
jgi:rare lipoprotein A